VAVVVLLATGACGDDEEPASTTSAAGSATSTTTEASPATDPTIPPTTSGPGTATVPTTPAVDAEPRFGGTVVIGSLDEPETLNPLAPGGLGTARSRIGQLYLAGISDVAPDLTLVPDLLARLPTVDDGGIVVDEEEGTMTVTLEIHPDAVWADEVPVSGGDLLFTYQTLLGLEERRRVPGADADLYAQIIPDSVEVGPKTFTFTMERATVQHELLFPVVLPRHRLSGTDVTIDDGVAPWPSAGPFVVESWNRGSSLTFTRNLSYWRTNEDGEPLPYLDRVEFRFYDSAAELIDAFRIREVDVIQPPPMVESIDALMPLATGGAGVFVIPGTLWEHIEFQFGENNRNPTSLNESTAFRQAVAYAIDLDALTASLYSGYALPIASHLDVVAPSLSTGAWSTYAHDVEEARRLLEQACAEAGRRCELVPPVVVFSTTADGDLRVRLAALIEPMLETVGIGVELQLEPSTLFFGETLLAGTWDVGVWAYDAAPGSTGVVRAHDVLDPAGPPPFGSNFARWGTEAVSGQEPITAESGETVDLNQGPSSAIGPASARFAELRRRMDGAVDADDLGRLVQEAEEILADEAVIIPLFARIWLGAVWLDEVGGYEPNPTAAGDTWTIEGWYRADDPVEGGGDG
jgi:peptide/nickel transport system substrate-binding protein